MKVLTIVLFIVFYVSFSVICGGIFTIIEAKKRKVSVMKNIRDNRKKSEEYFALGFFAPVLIPVYLVYKLLLFLFKKLGIASFWVADTLSEIGGR